jgi:molybdate/tungstate transport system substrate-binding protein
VCTDEEILMRRRDILLAGGALPFLSATHSHFARAAATAGTVAVLYAGSLVNLMEHGVGPAFATDDHGEFRGFAGGSNGLANEIKGRLRQGDVFISANPRVNDDLMGSINGDWVSWYVTFAQSPLVIGYNPSSRFAADLKSKPWYQVLQEPGIRIGRTDPKLDPKGKLTVDVLQKAAQIHKLPDLSNNVLGAPENPAQVFPEENLIGRLQSGQLDVGFFYSTETADLKIPAIMLPPDVTLSAHYTVTMLRDAPNPAGAAQFIDFLLGNDGRKLMRQHGLDLVSPSIAGDASKVPESVRSALHK